MNARSATLFASLLGLFGVALAQVGLTPAGTQISNQAFATYTDSAGNVIGDDEPPVASNTVITTVLPVYSVNITPDGAGPATPSAENTETAVGGEFVTFAYTVTNQGNATDTVNLSVVQSPTGTAGDTFDLTNVVIYRDLNGNGAVDPGEPTITGVANLAAGASAQVVVRGTVPPGVVTGDVANVNLVGSSNNGVGVTDENNWARATTLAQPNVTLTLTSDPVSGSDVTPNQAITYTLSGSNTGGSSPFAVDNVVTLNGTPTDGILLSEPVPVGLTYNAGSLSGSFTYAGTTAGTLVYSTNGGTTWTATEPPAAGVTNVGVLLPFSAGTRLNGNDPDLTYTLSFSATVPANALAGDDYDATGNLRYDRNGNGTAELATENANSLPVVHEVAVVNTLALGPDGFPAGNGSGTYTQANPNAPADTAVITRSGDTQTVATVDNGRTVTFQHSLQNTGTTSDVYDLSFTAPAGFTGTVTFTELNGTPISADDIALAAGATADFLVTITISDNYVIGSPSSFTVTATSENDPAASDSTTDTIGEITEDDLYGVTIGSSDGTAATPPGPDNTVTATPGQTINIPLELINNGNNNPDTFNLSGTTTLPGSPSPIFYAADPDCNGTPNGGPISSITLQPGQNVCLVAQVFVPNGTAFDDYELVTTATSPTSGVTDSVTTTIAVGVTEDFVFSPDLAQSTNPGQPTVYQHTVVNNSNAPATVSFTVTEPGTPGYLYEYSLDGATYTANLATLTPLVGTGATQNFFVRVTPPTTAADGATDSITITATPSYNGTTGTADTVTDTTTVTAGALSLQKSVSDTEAAPGENLTYTIVGTNTGTGAIGNVQIRDTLPDNTATPIADTEFVSVSATSTVTGTVLYSTDGGATWSATPPTTLGATGTFYVGVDTNASGSVTTADTMPGGATITITFVVQVADGQ